MIVIATPYVYAEDLFCENGETVLFSCDTGKKQIALCASDNLSKQNGYVQYRAKRNGKYELVYPSSKIHPRGQFFESTMLWAHDDEQRVYFQNGEYLYLLYDRSFSEDSEDSRAGVMVFHNGKDIADIKCKEKKDPFKRAFSIWISKDEGPFEHKDLLY